MDSNMPWPGGFGSGTPAFGQHATSGQEGEDWEDWLRWDPAADPTSPDTGTFHSGSSKNDSPLQDLAIPVLPGSDLFGKRSGDGTLAPPLIVGEDALDFGMNSMLSNEPFLFGLSNNAASGFDSNAQAYLPLQQEIPRIDTNWTLPSNVQPEEVTLSALSNEHARFPFNALPPDNIPDLHRSTGSSSQQRTSSSGNSDSNSPPHSVPKKRAGRKRKAEIEQEKAAENGESVDGDEPLVKKTSHNVIEKRYRNNLNDKIVELRNAVPALRAMGRADNGGDEEDLEGLTPAHKLNKATVMGKATEYIKHLEKRNKTIADEMEALQARLDAVEAAIGTSRDRQASMSKSSPRPGSSMRPRQSSGASQKSASGSLYASQDAPRYSGQSGVQQQQYTQSQQQPNYAPPPRPAVDAQNQQGQYVYGRNRGGVVGKVMMGAMASIMIMEGFSGGQQDDDDTRQLFAVPTTLLKRGLVESASRSPATLARHATLPLLKLMCIIGAFLYLIIPLLHFSTRRKHHKKRHAIRLPQVPSLASPVEVRRKAWLTALQTVYVPKHFLLEVAAVTAKMVSLSLRRLIGSDTWNAITGTNKEEAAARCKAWDIAIDAQLAGGDAEVSYHRLLLTLMASGTLPDSPVRLMQKAVHFRVFFWELSNAGYGNMVGFKALTEKVGRIYWDSARKLQKELTQTQHQYGGHRREEEEVELLPDHLAHLVDLDCDDVLNDEMIQRGWNLAWNKPSAFHTTPNTPRDSVVEDHAIRSPLDAVAAWYANMIIDDTLLNAMGEHPSSLDTEYYLNLAIGITPPASATQVRALAAKAVLSSTRRDANIIAALEALPPASTTASSMNLVNHAPAAPDVRTALTLAKLLSLLSPNSSSTSAPSTAQSREKAFDRLAALHIPAPNLTLLTAVACYHLLRLTTQERLALPSRAAQGLEDTAANLRLWIGTLAGRRAGLEGEECGRVVDLCLGVVGKVGGWVGEADSGYGSGCGSGDVSPVR